MMKNFRYVLPVLLGALLMGCASTPSAPSTSELPTLDGVEPSGTFTVRNDEVMRMAAGASGNGTLILHGWQHPFTFAGAKVRVMGDSTVELKGAVYNLESVEDFEGTYSPIKTEITAGKGLEGIWGENANGVTFYVDTSGLDLEIDLKAAGATVTLDD